MLPPRLQPPPGAIVVVAVLVTGMVVGTGCQTGADVRPGLRTPYRQARVGVDMAVAPFFAESTFGLGRDALDARLAWAESAAHRWLRRQGADVVPAHRVRRALARHGDLELLRADGMLHGDLSRAFEGARRDAKTSTQFRRLSDLRRDDVLTSRFVLFGELVYHTETECQTRADAFNSWSSVVVRPAAPPRGARPCVVTHFRARLVDARFDRTVWYGRHLVEHHVGRIHSGDRRRNVELAVERTLDHGGDLRHLLRRGGPTGR